MINNSFVTKTVRSRLEKCPCTSIEAEFGIMQPYSVTIGEPSDSTHQKLSDKIEKWVGKCVLMFLLS